MRELSGKAARIKEKLSINNKADNKADNSQAAATE